MRKIIKDSLLLAAFLWMLQPIFAFTPTGPVGNGGDAWQIQANGFNPLQAPNPVGFTYELPTGPKNIGEGYRRNTPVLYYTFDQNFVNFFGSDGTNAVTGAFNILNNLTNVDNYSTSLTEFPLQSSAINYQAQALELYDVKSLTLAALMDQLGLDDAIRYTWTLHARWHVGSVACPVGEEYLVTERNLDIAPTPTDQWQYTPYVNGSLYTYLIFEDCGTGPDLPINGWAIPYAADPLSENAPVASGVGFGYLLPGQFYTGLTRDDVAGLRYLLRAGNINTESPTAGSLLQTTTVGPITPLATSDLSALASAASVTDPATLVAEFPGLVVSSTVTNYTPVFFVTNIVTYLTNLNGSAYGNTVLYTTTTVSPTFAIATNYTSTFANVITNSYLGNNSKVTILTVSNLSVTGAPYDNGIPGATRSSTTTFTVTNVPSGDYYIIPAGTCGWSLLGLYATITNSTTNLVLSVSNTAGFFISQSVVTSFTQHIYRAQQIFCDDVTPPTGNYEGIEHMQFVHVDYRNYDTLTGLFTPPITNSYTMSLQVHTNNTDVVVIQNFQRVVTTPDFLFSATDETSLAGAQTLFQSTTPNWNESNILPGAAGPGTIDPVTQITYNKSGLVYENDWPLTSGPNDAAIGFAYASFDGTTNTPVVYPNGTSIASVENEVFIQLSPLTLSGATNGVPYSVTFTVAGGQSPYTWSVATGSSLPAGFALSSGGVLSGTSHQSGIFDFVVQMNDSATHVVQRNYTLTIN